MKRLAALGTLALLSGCIHYKNAPIVNNGPPQPEGTAVAIDQPVQAGALVVTPRAVVEDSRCPENARCVWAGRLVVSTRIEGPEWRETIELALGESYAAHGTSVTLVSGLPEKQAGRDTPPQDYRFVYEGGR